MIDSKCHSRMRFALWSEVSKFDGWMHLFTLYSNNCFFRVGTMNRVSSRSIEIQLSAVVSTSHGPGVGMLILSRRMVRNKVVYRSFHDRCHWGDWKKKIVCGNILVIFWFFIQTNRKGDDKKWRSIGLRYICLVHEKETDGSTVWDVVVVVAGFQDQFSLQRIVIGRGKKNNSVNRKGMDCSLGYLGVEFGFVVALLQLSIIVDSHVFIVFKWSVVIDCKLPWSFRIASIDFHVRRKR